MITFLIVFIYIILGCFTSIGITLGYVMENKDRIDTFDIGMLFCAIILFWPIVIFCILCFWFFYFIGFLVEKLDEKI